MTAMTVHNAADRYSSGYGRNYGVWHNLAVHLIWVQDCVGSNPVTSMSPGSSRIVGSTSGHCPAKIKGIWVLLAVRALNLGIQPI